jgi:hypothetical protein
MKKFALFAMLLTAGLLSFGCEKPAAKPGEKPAAEKPAEGGTEKPAETPAEKPAQ